MKKWMNKISAVITVLSVMLLSSVITPANTEAETEQALEQVYITTNGGNAASVLTVNYTFSGNEDDLQYQWYYTDGYPEICRPNNTHILSGATGKTYQLTSDSIGKYIFCMVTPPNGRAVFSMSYGKVVAADITESSVSKPAIDSESMNIWARNGRVGDTLYAHYAYSNPAGVPEGESEIIWQRSDDYNSGYKPIEGATGKTYTLTPEDYGKFINYKVTPKDMKGTAGTTAEFKNKSNSSIYCTPENLLLGASGTTQDSGYDSELQANSRAVSDFIINRQVNEGAKNRTIKYTVDAGNVITFDKLVLFCVNFEENALQKIEISKDGNEYTDILSEGILTKGIDSYILELAVPSEARYIKITYASGGKYPKMYDVQAFLKPESFSEILGTTLNGASYARENRTILNIPEGTSADALVKSLRTSTAVPDMKIIGYNGEEISGDDVVLSGYCLVSTSANGFTETEYQLSVTEEIPAVVVSAVDISVGVKGIRVASEVAGDYKLFGVTEAPDDTQTTYQWYFAPDADGEFMAISGATKKTYIPTEKQVGGFLKFEVIPFNGPARRSKAAGKIKTAISNVPTAPTCESVIIETSSEVVYENDVLIGRYIYFDDNADDEDQTKTEKQWFRVGSDGKKTAIENAAEETYTLTEADVACEIIYGVKPYAVEEPHQPAEYCYSKGKTVTKEPAQADYEELKITGDLKNVTSNLILPLKGRAGSDIKWMSSDENVIGLDGVVTRQTSNQYVTLTAKIKHADRDLELEKVFPDICVVAKKTISGGSGGSGGGSSVVIPPIKNTFAPEATPTPAEKPSSDTKIEIADMKSDDWAYPYVAGLMEQGVLSMPEDGNFRPTSPLKREEGIKMLVELFGWHDENINCDFADVGREHWAYTYIASAAEMGLVSGIGDGIFGCGMDITRQDFAVMAYNALMKYGTKKQAVKETVLFVDDADIGDYAKEAVQYLAKGNIISGTPDGMFMPKDRITRQEAAKIIYFLINE